MFDFTMNEEEYNEFSSRIPKDAMELVSEMKIDLGILLEY